MKAKKTKNNYEETLRRFVFRQLLESRRRLDKNEEMETGEKKRMKNKYTNILRILLLLVILSSSLSAKDFACYHYDSRDYEARCQRWCFMKTREFPGSNCSSIALVDPVDWASVHKDCNKRTDCEFNTHSTVFSDPDNYGMDLGFKCLGDNCHNVRFDSCYGVNDGSLPAFLQRMKEQGETGSFGTGKRCITLHQTYCGMTYSEPVAPWGGVSTAVEFCVDCKLGGMLTAPGILGTIPIPNAKPMICTGIATLPACGEGKPSMGACYSEGETARCGGKLKIDSSGKVTRAGLQEMCCKNYVTGANTWKTCAGDPEHPDFSCSCPTVPTCRKAIGNSCDGYGPTDQRPGAASLRPSPHNRCFDTLAGKNRNLCCKDPNSSKPGKMGREDRYGGKPKSGVWAPIEECGDVLDKETLGLPDSPIGNESDR